jgi:hypothetical protein
VVGAAGALAKASPTRDWRARSLASGCKQKTWERSLASSWVVDTSIFLPLAYGTPRLLRPAAR